jgi:hypothetical protein
MGGSEEVLPALVRDHQSDRTGGLPERVERARLVAGRDDVVVGPEAAAQMAGHRLAVRAEHQKDRPHVIASGGGYGSGQGIIVRQGAVNVDPS